MDLYNATRGRDPGEFHVSRGPRPPWCVFTRRWRTERDEVKAGSELAPDRSGIPFIDRAITCCFMVQVL